MYVLTTTPTCLPKCAYELLKSVGMIASRYLPAIFNRSLSRRRVQRRTRTLSVNRTNWRLVGKTTMSGYVLCRICVTIDVQNEVLLMQLWMVHPNIMPQSVLEGAGTDATAPRPPRVEYLATLSRHSAAVNVVRWSPSGTRQSAFSCTIADLFAGELIASAGDGMRTSSPLGFPFLMIFFRWHDYCLGAELKPPWSKLR